jgi:hypothetical protein
MAARPRPIFFSYLAQMLREQFSRPGNFLPSLVYLHLLCLPRHYWHASDLLRFPHSLDFYQTILGANIPLAVQQRLPPYEFLWQRLSDLLLYLESRPVTPSPSRSGRHRTRLSATEVVRLLDNPAFRTYLIEQVNHELQGNPELAAHRQLYQQHGLPCLEWTAPELISHALTLLEQQGWLEMVAAAPEQDISIRFHRVPTPTAEQRP